MPGKETRAPSFVTNIRDAARTGSAAAVARAHLKANGGRYRIADPARDLEVLEVIDSDGTETVRFAQKHNGVPVFGAQYLVHMDKSKAGRAVESVNGHYFTDLEAPATPRINAASAEELARRRARMNIAKVDRHGLTILPPVLPGGDALTYHFTVWGERFGKPAKQEMFINARTGAQQLAYNNLQHTHEPTSVVPGTTSHGNIVTVNTFHADQYEMRDRTKPMFALGGVIKTHDVLDTPGFYNATNANIVKTTTDFNSPSRYRAAVDAHVGAGLVYDYFKNLGRESIDGQGMDIVSSVHYSEDGSGYCNAFWTGAQMVYGDCGPSTEVHPLTADLDVIGHELTHGVTQYTANLVYLNQSGAMNEAYSDYFGNAIDVDNTPGMTMDNPESGEIGEDICIVDDPSRWECPLRSLNDGRGVNKFVYYLADYDNGGVHLNSTIYGGALWKIRTVIDKTKADKVIYKALSEFHTPLDDFVDGRTRILQAADTVPEVTPDEKTKIVQAFDDKGIVAGWDVNTTNDAKIIRRDVAPLGFFVSPPQVSGSRYTIGDYENQEDLCCKPGQIFVGKVTDGPAKKGQKVGDHNLAATLNDEQPDIAGKRAVWAHIFVTSGGNIDVNVRGRVLGGKKKTYAGGRGFQWFPSISGNLLAWEDTRAGHTDIWARRIGRKPKKIAGARREQWVPQVSGDWIAWWDLSRSLPRIGLKNFRTGKSVVIKPNRRFMGPPGMGPNHVYWYEDSNGDGFGAIRRARLGTAKRQTVVPEKRGRKNLSPFWSGLAPSMPVVYANKNFATYSDDFGYFKEGTTGWPSSKVGRDVFRVRLARLPRKPALVTNNRGDQAYPVILGGRSKVVLWLDSSFGRTDLMRRPK